MSAPVLFALGSSRPQGLAMAERLGIALGQHEERRFEDGEHKIRPLRSVRDRDVYVLSALYDEPGWTVNDKLCRLAFFCGAVRDAAAARVTAVVPYLCYARKERKTKARDPITTRYVAGMLESVGIDRVVTLDVHELGAFQNAFRIHTEHLQARPLFLDYLGQLDERPFAVVSPDVGGVKRAQHLAEGLAARTGQPVQLAFMEKRRSAGVVSGEALVGEVSGRRCVIVDDLVSTGGTLARAGAACRDAGATEVHALATHGLFVGDASATLAAAPLDRIVITDAVPPFRLDPAVKGDKVVVLECAPLLATAIHRMSSGGSIVELLEP